MPENTPGDFKLGSQHSEDRLLIAQNLQEMRVEKLSTRVTLISFLIPVFIGIIFTIAYLDIKNRVLQMHDTGISELQKLSSDLESKFSALSIRYAKLEESFSKREEHLEKLEESFSKKVAPIEEVFLSIEKTISTLKNDVDRLNASHERTETALKTIQTGKADVTLVNERLGEAGENLKVINNNFNELIGQMESLDKDLKSEMLALTNFVGKDKNTLKELTDAIPSIAEEITKLKNDLAKVKRDTAQQVNSDFIKLELERSKLALTVEVQEIQRLFSKRLQDLEKRVNIAETELAAIRSTGAVREQNLP
jgi:chromosome segregation ATPase